MKKILLATHWRFALLSIALAISISSCSSSVTVTATRFAGIVLDTSMTVDVGEIKGVDAGEFRGELLEAIRSAGAFTVPSVVESSDTLVASETSESARLLIGGSYRHGVEERTYKNFEEGEWVKYREKRYAVVFEYEVHDVLSREFVVNGYVDESMTETEREEEEDRPFLESIAHAIVVGIVGGIIEGIFSESKYKILRKSLIRRFVHEISPHELRADVKLFKDKDIPELEDGIDLAKLQKWNEAAAVFQSAIDNHPGAKNLHKAFYNLGVAYEYGHQFELAFKHFDKALAMEDNDDYHNELQSCIRFEQEYRWRQRYLERLQMLN